MVDNLVDTCQGDLGELRGESSQSTKSLSDTSSTVTEILVCQNFWSETNFFIENFGPPDQFFLKKVVRI